jgi:hypothetical protein
VSVAIDALTDFNMAVSDVRLHSADCRIVISIGWQKPLWTMSDSDARSEFKGRRESKEDHASPSLGRAFQNCEADLLNR